MKLWLISQTVNQEYDTYDSAVVAAETEDEARHLVPYAGDYVPWLYWAPSEHVNVKLLGEAEPGTSVGVIHTSFNAG